MEAFEILKVPNDIDRFRSQQQTEEQVNNVIENRAKRLANFQMNRIIRIIEDNLPISQKLEMISKELYEAKKIILAYKKISNKSNRDAYIDSIKNKQEQTIKDTIDLAISYRSTNPYFYSDKKIDAYQILQIPTAEEDNSELDEMSSKLQNTTLQHLRETLEATEYTTIEELEEIIDSYQAKIWALSKLATPQQRALYNEQLEEAKLPLKYEGIRQQAIASKDVIKNATKYKAKEVETKRISLTETINSKLVNAEIDFAIIYRIGKIKYDEIASNEEYQIMQYDVTKHAKSGANISNIVYSDIDFEKIDNDPQYAEAVRKLISSSNITAGKQYLSGYIGKVDENSTIKHDAKDAALCILWKEHEQGKANETDKTDATDATNKTDVGDLSEPSDVVIGTYGNRKIKYAPGATTPSSETIASDSKKDEEPDLDD